VLCVWLFLVLISALHSSCSRWNNGVSLSYFNLHSVELSGYDPVVSRVE
jgi:hypothetical protein